MSNTLHLIACAATKRQESCRARDLYQGDLFRKSVAYVEALRAPWAILSAQHGILAPETVIEPYNRSLTAMRPKERLFWGAWAVDQLCSLDAGRDFVFLAGKSYREPMMRSQLWRALRYDSHVPMEGLGIGQQKQWLMLNTPSHP